MSFADRRQARQRRSRFGRVPARGRRGGFLGLDRGGAACCSPTRRRRKRWPAAQMRPAQREVLTRLFPVVVVKRGADGAEVWRGEEIWRAPAPASRVVDTTGAGDAFAAAFLAARLSGAEMQSCLERAVAAGSAVVGFLGGRLEAPLIRRHRSRSSRIISAALSAAPPASGPGHVPQWQLSPGNTLRPIRSASEVPVQANGHAPSRDGDASIALSLSRE